MFNIISWQTYLTLIVAVISCYYVVTSLSFYHKEIRNWFQSFGKVKPQTTTPIQESLESSDFMGRANSTPTEESVRVSSVSANDLITYGEYEDTEVIEESSSPDSVLMVGSVADLLQEIKTLIQLIAEDETGKSESKALFNALFLRYPHLHNTSYSQAINLYLLHEEKDKFSFELTADELQSWWNTSDINSISNNH